ncbi:helix-turn-helix domain-containing protein [Symmachiella dynata]|uniref:helix-turn-helix domain-containing protein n=1 Tax=Symmachiella dynata TaxID=2527995 RepID=UPI0030EB338C
MATAIHGDGDMLTIDDLCRRFRCTRYKIYRMMREDNLPFVQFGGRRLIRRDSLEAWIDARESNNGVEADGDDE